MADLSVTPISTQVKPMPGMSLGEILAAARSAQEYRQAKEINPLLVERAETELKRLKGLMPEELSKAQSEAQVARETVEPRIAASKSTADTAASQAQEARLKVFQNYLANTRMEAADLLKQPEITYNDVVNKFTQSVNNATDDEALRKQILAQGLQDIPKDLSSDQYRAFLANSLVKTVNTETQLTTRFPSVSLVSTGAKTGVPVTTGGEMAVQRPGQVGAGGVSMELPIGTQVYNPKTNQYEFVGAPSGASSGAAPAVAKPSPETSALLESRGKIISTDLQTTLQKAEEAQNNIAILQNVKGLTPEAFTGFAAERQQLAGRLGAFLGIEPAQLRATATEELQKNVKLRQLAGGNTDAERALAELANPNIKMTKEAIINVSNHLIALEQMNVAKASYMAAASNDPKEYFQRKLNWNKINDPRLFLDQKPQELDRMYNAMSESDKKQFGEKLKLAKKWGVIP